MKNGASSEWASRRPTPAMPMSQAMCWSSSRRPEAERAQRLGKGAAGMVAEHHQFRAAFAVKHGERRRIFRTQQCRLRRCGLSVLHDRKN